jgi:chromosome segregation ATPase
MSPRSKVDVSHAIDLLWFHQIRRENTALHIQVKQLQQQIDCYDRQSQEQRNICHEARSLADRASENVKNILAAQDEVRNKIENIEQQSKEASDLIASLKKRSHESLDDQNQAITKLTHSHEKMMSDLVQLQTSHNQRINKIEVSMQGFLDQLGNKVDRSEIECLLDRVSLIENAQHERGLDSVTHVADSVEAPRGDQGNSKTLFLLNGCL